MLSQVYIVTIIIVLSTLEFWPYYSSSTNHFLIFSCFYLRCEKQLRWLLIASRKNMLCWQWTDWSQYSTHYIICPLSYHFPTLSNLWSERSFSGISQFSHVQWKLGASNVPNQGILPKQRTGSLIIMICAISVHPFPFYHLLGSSIEVTSINVQSPKHWSMIRIPLSITNYTQETDMYKHLINEVHVQTLFNESRGRIHHLPSRLY